MRALVSPTASRPSRSAVGRVAACLTGLSLSVAGIATPAMAVDPAAGDADLPPLLPAVSVVDVSRTVTEDGTTILRGPQASGATWEGRVPTDWNGTVILYAHGFRGPGANPAWDQKNDPTLQELQNRGFAVVASSYSTTQWALGTAVQDQLVALGQFTSLVGEPERTIAYGRSMGGLVTALLAEVPNSGIDGAVPTCGLLTGGVNLNNMQLDAAYAAAVLLVGDPDLRLTGFRSPDESAPTVAAIRAAIEEARTTDEGRARLALVSAFLNLPTHIEGVDAKDAAELSAAQADLLSATLGEVISRRSGIVTFAGGDSGWNAGADYTAMLNASARKQQVRSMYRAAGLDLRTDLAELDAEADIVPDSAALTWMRETSTPTGDLQVPVFATHTLYDLLAPVEFQEEYAETVREAGDSALLRQAYTDNVGHCVYSVAETVASIDVMIHRLDTGHWGPTNARSLTRSSADLGLDGSAWVTYRPREFVSDREWEPLT